MVLWRVFSVFIIDHIPGFRDAHTDTWLSQMPGLQGQPLALPTLKEVSGIAFHVSTGVAC